MSAKGKYTTPSGFRMALENRLKAKSVQTGIELIRLRRRVSFDRFINRLFSGNVSGLVMKGGYALELRIERARTTKDMDFAFTGNLMGVWTGDPDDLQIFLTEKANIDLGDFFEYRVGKSTLDLENAVYGGYRFPVEAIMDNRQFSAFSIDIASGDAWIEPHDGVSLNDWLGFAGIPTVKIPVITAEQQFAEKLHSYTLERENPNSRVKDIIDMVLLIKHMSMSPQKLKEVTLATFTKRNTHPFPPPFNSPPERWSIQYPRLAGSCSIAESLEQAVNLVRTFCVNAKIIQ